VFASVQLNKIGLSELKNWCGGLNLGQTPYVRVDPGVTELFLDMAGVTELGVLSRLCRRAQVRCFKKLKFWVLDFVLHFQLAGSLI